MRRAAGASSAGVTAIAGTAIAPQNWQFGASTFSLSSADVSFDADEISRTATGMGWEAWATAWTVPQTTMNTAMNTAAHARRARVPGTLLRTGLIITS